MNGKRCFDVQRNSFGGRSSLFRRYFFFRNEFRQSLVRGKCKFLSQSPWDVVKCTDKPLFMRKVYCDIDIVHYKISSKSQGNNVIKPFLVVIMCVKSTSAYFGLFNANEH